MMLISMSTRTLGLVCETPAVVLFASPHDALKLACRDEWLSIGGRRVTRIGGGKGFRWMCSACNYRHVSDRCRLTPKPPFFISFGVTFTPSGFIWQGPERDTACSIIDRFRCVCFVFFIRRLLCG